MVTVDQRGVHRTERRQHIETQRGVEGVAAGELPLVLGWVEVGDRVDHVQLGLGAETLEHAYGRLAAQRTDLDDARGARCIQDRGDSDIPQWEHGAAKRPFDL